MAILLGRAPEQGLSPAVLNGAGLATRGQGVPPPGPGAAIFYTLDFLHQVKEASALTYDRIQYIEQPAARELETHRDNVMHEAAKLKPVVIDESLTGVDRLLLEREMGYSGVAFEILRRQSQSLLLAAAGQKYKMFLCVQDLTCPGASLIHSAGLAAHVPGRGRFEANARQFIPDANSGWEAKFPGIFSYHGRNHGHQHTHRFRRGRGLMTVWSKSRQSTVFFGDQFNHRSRNGNVLVPSTRWPPEKRATCPRSGRPSR